MTGQGQSNSEVAVGVLQALPLGGPGESGLADDAVWWVLGHTNELPAHHIFSMMKSLFTDGRMEVDAVTADGDRVAVEARSFMTAKDGREYSNSYHFLVELRDGKVIRVKEYCDTARTNAFFAPAA